LFQHESQIHDQTLLSMDAFILVECLAHCSQW
jgi:hypothetical protein